MDYLAVVHVFESKADLREPIKNLIFIEELTFLILDFFGEISSIGVLHHNAKPLFFSHKDLFKPDDVRMFKLLKNFGFLEGFLFLVIRHGDYVHLLDHPELLVLVRLDEEGLAKCSLSKELKLLILIEICHNLFINLLYVNELRTRLHLQTKCRRLEKEN